MNCPLCEEELEGKKELYCNKCNLLFHKKQVRKNL